MFKFIFALLLFFITHYGKVVIADPRQPILEPYLGSSIRAKSPMKIIKNSKGVITELSTDTNGDGKSDIFDTFSKGGALIRTEDRNFDGKIDRTTKFPTNHGEKTIIESDENFDGKIDRVEERSTDGNYIVIRLKIDKKFNGKFDFETVNRVRRENAINIEHGDSDCGIRSGTIDQLKNLQEFSKLFNNAESLGSLSGDFYSTNFGYLIQEECVNKFGSKSVLNLIAGSLKKGLACQWQLGTRQGRANVHKVSSLILNTSNPPKIICDETGYNWGQRSVAHATTPGDEMHPTISFNPTELNKRSSEDWAETFFHETMHNVGYLHEKDIEFPYTCSACCFGNSTKEAKKMACKICAGQYTGTSDKNYVNDITQFYILDNREERNMGIILNALIENPTDRWTRFKFVTANSTDYRSPLAVGFAQSLRKHYSQLSSAEISDLKKTENLGDSKFVRDFLPATRPLADALIRVLDGDLKSSEAFLKQIHLPASQLGSSDKYNLMKQDVNELKKDIAWKLYDNYEARDDKESAIRIFQEFIEGH